MADKLGDKFRAYRPTKTVWFWSTAASVVLTMVVGFTVGGWVTGGAATDRAEVAANDAAAQLAAVICASTFLAAPDAGVELAALKDKRAFERNSILEKGGWVSFAGSDAPIKGAAKLCADRLAEAEAPDVPEVVPVAEVPVADITIDSMSVVAPAAN